MMFVIVTGSCCNVHCRPSYALQSIKKKIENENPHVAKFALQVRMNEVILNKERKCADTIGTVLVACAGHFPTLKYEYFFK